MRVGVATTLRSSREAVRLAEAAEEAGFWGIGFADTAPRLFQAAYPTITASLLATGRIHVGPFVTNPVSQHWSVHASTARALDELAPGRFFLGMSTGDGAVHSVGLRPARWSEVEQAVGSLRSIAPEQLEIHLAASGPRGTEVAGRIATDLTLAVGLDPEAIGSFAARARDSRVAAGVRAPLRIWGKTLLCVVRNASDLGRARLQTRGLAYGNARYAFDGTFEGKFVPEHWQPLIRERLVGYDFGQHSVVSDDNPNNFLFEDQPELEDYLTNRWLTLGTPDECAAKLSGIERDAGLDGLWLGLVPSPLENDPSALLGLAADVLSSVEHEPAYQ